MYYNTWENLEQGWEKLQPVIEAAATCPESDGKTVFFDAMDKYRAYFEQSSQ